MKRNLNYLSPKFASPLPTLCTNPAGTAQSVATDSFSLAPLLPTDTWNENTEPEAFRRSPSQSSLARAGQREQPCQHSHTQASVQSRRNWRRVRTPLSSTPNSQSPATKTVFHKVGSKFRLTAKSDLDM